MEEVLKFLIETVKPLLEDSSIKGPEKIKISDGNMILLDENRELTDRVNQSSELFLTVDTYLMVLIDKIGEIVLPLTKDTTVDSQDKKISLVILEGYDILNDDSIELKERIQQACDKFDEAQYMPYNPYHSRVALARAIATYEYSYGGKEFRRTKKDN